MLQLMLLNFAATVVATLLVQFLFLLLLLLSLLCQKLDFIAADLAFKVDFFTILSLLESLQFLNS